MKKSTIKKLVMKMNPHLTAEQYRWITFTLMIALLPAAAFAFNTNVSTAGDGGQLGNSIYTFITQAMGGSAGKLVAMATTAVSGLMFFKQAYLPSLGVAAGGLGIVKSSTIADSFATALF